MELRPLPPVPSCGLASQGHRWQVSPDPALPLGCVLFLQFIFLCFSSGFFFFFLFFGGLEISSRRLRAEARGGLPLLEVIHPPSCFLAAFLPSGSGCLPDAGAAADNIHSGPCQCCFFFLPSPSKLTPARREPSQAPGCPRAASRSCSQSLNGAQQGREGGMRLNFSVLVNLGAVTAKEQLLLSGARGWENKKRVHKRRCPWSLLNFFASSPREAGRQRRRLGWGAALLYPLCAPRAHQHPPRGVLTSGPNTPTQEGSVWGTLAS